TLEDLDLPVSLELPAHPVLQPRTMLGHRVMQHPLLVLEQVVEHEIAVKVLAAQIVDNRLDAHAGVGAAFDEIALELHAMVASTRQYVSSPDNRLVRVALRVGFP